MKSLHASKPKISARSKRRKPRRVPGAIYFPEARGKVLEDVHVTTEADCNCVILCFDDKTELVVDIDPCFTVSADYSDWKTGDQRVIKRWPRVRNAP